MKYFSSALFVAAFVCIAQASNLKDVYNVVVLGNKGVGKSALLNMFAGEDLFKVGDSAMSETSIAASQVHKFMGRPDAINLRLIDTQGLSDTGGDSKDMSHIKNMVDYIKQLQEIDLFIICFDGPIRDSLPTLSRQSRSSRRSSQNSCTTRSSCSTSGPLQTRTAWPI